MPLKNSSLKLQNVSMHYLTKIKSPFKFLDPFNKSDRGFFFGRDKEVIQLYDFVNKNRVVLVYGQSGTGKTSIIQCGLANEFETSDWNPFMIRREDDLNKSLLKSLKNEINVHVDEEEIENFVEILFAESTVKNNHTKVADIKNDHGEKRYIASVVFYLQKVIERFLRPVYLIFDQFEELLILGTEAEKKRFVNTLQTLLGPNRVVDCNIIIVMREEYFAWLDGFEKDIPGISDRRIRIEPMRTKEIEQVIIDSCRTFNITLTNPENNVKQMISAVSKNADISLPYLQVYMDQLWRNDYKNTYPDGYHGGEEFIPLSFTTEEIIEFGKIKDVMQRFLIERRSEFQKEVRIKYHDIPDNFLTMILDCFVNVRGTKMPNAFDLDNGFYKFSKRSPRLLHETKPELLKFTLDFLQRNQVLRNSGNSFELAHDIFAKLIDQQRDAKQKRLNGIHEMITIQKKSGELLPYDLVKSWASDIDQVGLREDERSFFEESKIDGEQKVHKRLYEEELKNAIEKEKTNFELKTIKRKKSNVIRLLALLSVVIISFLMFGYWSNLKKSDYAHALRMLDRLDNLSADPKADDSIQNDILALAKYAYDFGKKDSFIKKITEERIFRILRNHSFAKSFSKYSLTLNSSAGLLDGLDIDMSGNGKFMVIRNDSIQLQNIPDNQKSLFHLININADTITKSFPNVLYSYFINRTDTLLLAFSDDSTNRSSSAYPNWFILYDCTHNLAMDTLYLSTGQSLSDRLLYNKSFLSQNAFSEWDSYKVRMISSNQLVVPCLEFSSDIGCLELIDLRTKARKQLFTDSNSNSNYSISISRQFDKLLYFYDSANATIGEVYKNSERHEICRNANYADFNETDLIVYAKENVLFISNSDGKILKEYSLKNGIKNIMTNKEGSYSLVIDENENVNLVDLSKDQYMEYNNELLLGYNFKSKSFITRTKGVNYLKNDTIKLILRDFSGKELKRVFIANGIESFSFNETGNNILLKSNRIPKSNLQVLYLLDDTLSIKGTFFLTPNDAYGFSKDGKSVFFVRDNQLAVFDNKKFLDLYNFQIINDSLETQKNHNKHYKKDMKFLRKKYNIDRFPSQLLGFLFLR